MVPTAAVEVTQSLDVVTLASNFGILLGFIVAAALGIKKGLRAFARGDDRPAQRGAHDAVAHLLENQTLREWSETNRAVIESLAQLKSTLYLHRDALATHGSELAELRHQVERLRDKMG